jgi:hypothetical protein
MALAGAVALLATLRTLLVHRDRPLIAHGPPPVPLPIPVVVRVLQDDDELEQARRRAAEFEHLGVTSRWTQRQRYDGLRQTIDRELICRHSSS